MGALKHELGGKCSYCLEEDNWITIERYLNGPDEVLILKCLTPRYGEEDGMFLYECGNVIELLDGVRQP